ncbi:U3 small nucleolar RNA-associated protein NOL7 isoform X2 [Nothobranchius furzeri]|uniref:U3 small nucleolar RNA-associated protein NOL7 isoform X2 n=1 Tax=Nothobranchius furzeri TaxID=105023 RepID=UPI0039047C33
MSSLSNMAKKQRGKTRTGYFLKTGDVEKPTKAFALTLESSDDEAPEEVTFEDSKAQALRSLKRALDSAKREKELLKEKRRKKQELFQEQKKRKLLPVEVLEEIDSPPSEKHKQSEDGENQISSHSNQEKSSDHQTKYPHVFDILNEQLAEAYDLPLLPGIQHIPHRVRPLWTCGSPLLRSHC